MDAAMPFSRMVMALSTMSLSFETLGNATLVIYEDGKPVLATDPWLTGTCYFGSWALDRPLTVGELESVRAADYIWISHGHPDHFHVPSLALLPRNKKILLPDHYDHGMYEYLRERGFTVTVLAYRAWHRLSPSIRVLCLDNENQDAILLIEAGDSLVVNLNDSPLCGDFRFIRRVVKRFDRKRIYVAALCSNDADMFNLFDAAGRPLVDPPQQRKPGMVWQLARIVDRLGAGNYVSSASQHIYVRRDSVWANPHRVGWDDVERYWTRPAIRIIEPFVVVDLAGGAYECKHPSHASDESQITDADGRDDWQERMSEAEWSELRAFFNSIELLRPYIDYLDFTVGGEKRRIWINPKRRRKPPTRSRYIAFTAPRRSLMMTVRSGYFDDILIGNFMRAELHKCALYPNFTPIVAKLAGSAKVRTWAQWRAFRWRYFQRNPIGYIEWHLRLRRDELIEQVRRWSEVLGLKRPLKGIYRLLLRDPVKSG
jgi:Beta-lactamase superfamily domain